VDLFGFKKRKAEKEAEAAAQKAEEEAKLAAQKAAEEAEKAKLEEERKKVAYAEIKKLGYDEAYNARKWNSPYSYADIYAVYLSDEEFWGAPLYSIVDFTYESQYLGTYNRSSTELLSLYRFHEPCLCFGDSNIFVALIKNFVTIRENKEDKLKLTLLEILWEITLHIAGNDEVDFEKYLYKHKKALFSIPAKVWTGDKRNFLLELKDRLPEITGNREVMKLYLKEGIKLYIEE